MPRLMITDTLDSYILEGAEQLRTFNHELKLLERHKKLDPELRSLLYAARDALGHQNHALRAIRDALHDLSASVAEWR